MNILAFGFKENISIEVVNHLDVSIHKVALESNTKSLDDFILNTKFENYDLIIGTGLYNGVDKDKIRIETICTSQFRNNKANLITREMTPFFVESNEFRFTNRMGNSYCNLISYLITTKYPDSHFTFLHIPADYSVAKAARMITRQIQLLS